MRNAGRTWWIGWILGGLLLSVAAAALVGQLVERRAQAESLAKIESDARLRQVLLTSEIARFRLLPLALADDRDVAAAVRGGDVARRALDRKLTALARSTSASVIYVVGRDGLAIAASNWAEPQSFVGKSYAFRRYYRDAVRTGAGTQFALGTVSHRPGLYLSRRTPEGGVVVVKLEFDRIESEWRAAGGLTFVTDAAGVVLISSDTRWRFATTRRIDPSVAAAVRADSGAAVLRSPPFAILGDALRLNGQRSTLQHAVTAPGDEGWQVHLAMPLPPTIGSAVRTSALAAAAVMLAMVGALWGLSERSRRRALRTVELEAAVADRTRELRDEIEERIAAEARAAELREGLRQANRLAALGQITASVAHETARPVAAIRNYVAAARQLLTRGDTAAVDDNLGAIARLTDRIGLVTAELRGFARKGSGTIGPIRLADVIDGARLILKERLSDVSFVVPPIPDDLIVVAGRVRLEQVLVNLLQNAIEALGTTPDPRIAIELGIEPQTISLIVADNGPGIDPTVAERMFTPFVTSRATGLGLGLVIAQDIMTDLGGTLRLLPAEQGARFEVTLRRVP
ncbi:sensor histidine kinase [Sphingomonas sp. Leaf32]|uniref:sensor histidine kinase n=1 Tax=Sphingomonas sp. Leaf32 TaxID=1736214 RepID=UPI0006F4896E|nr:ATP-binding protein [Sphingomonas sp. Leaf32]KQN23686.1 histidine kinase [Sphingomonas sp. Leaf32]